VAKVAKTGKHVRFHDLRRTAVSLMRDLGVTEFTEGDISATTGHSIATKRRRTKWKQNGNIAPFGDSVINASF
jgi:integrase